MTLRGLIRPSWTRDKFSFYYGRGWFLTVSLPSATYPDSIAPGERILTFWRIAVASDDATLIPPKPMKFIQSQLVVIQDDFWWKLPRFSTEIDIVCVVCGVRLPDNCTRP
jgi:hypothetical protein